MKASPVARLLLLVPFALAAPAAEGFAQSTLTGTVRDATSKVPLADAEVLVAELKLRTRTDARGHYRLDEIEGGRFSVAVRKVGYDSVSALLGFSGADSSAHDFELARGAQPLAEVPVRGKGDPPLTAKLRGFEQRRAMGQGHFLNADDLLRDLNRRMSDVVQKIPGFQIVRGQGQSAYVGSSRGQQSILSTGKICVPGKGCASVCPVAIILDGLTLYRGEAAEPPFDVNTLQPSEIAGMEFYAGSGSVPPEFNATRRTCGVLVIWTK